SRGVDSSRLAIGGDSAGANLAVATSLALRDSGQPMPTALLLNYGAFSRNWQGNSYARFDGESYNLTAAEMESFWRGYVRNEDDLADPLVTPLLADVRDLPPTFFTVAACDILADENIALAERMRAAGVPVELNLYEGATHSFLEAVAISPLAGRALDAASQWLSAQLTD